MTRRANKINKRSRGGADLVRVRRVSDAEIARMAPPELADLPDDFWSEPRLVFPVAKEAISLRVDDGQFIDVDQAKVRF
jgi:hypothetical protein